MMEYDTSAPHHLMKPSNFPAKLFSVYPMSPGRRMRYAAPPSPHDLSVSMLELWIILDSSASIISGLLWFTMVC